MKRWILTAALAILGMAAYTKASAQDTHVLTSLWKQYEQASKADKPQQEAAILAQIKEQAQQRHLPVDFYDAAVQYADVRSRINWKDRAANETALAQEIEDFAEPIVTYTWLRKRKYASSDDCWAYVQAHLDGFNGRTSALWSDLSRYLNGAIEPYVVSDREYVLWDLLESRSFKKPEEDKLYQLLKAEVAGRYPSEAALEYYVICNSNYTQEASRREALQKLADEWPGKAVSLYPKSDLLRLEFLDLNKQKAGSEAYKALYQRCKDFEKERSAYKGEEAALAKGCTSVQNLMANLTAEQLRVSCEKGRALVYFQNQKEATLTLYQDDDKKLQSWQVSNPQGSFYVQDSVIVALPVLPDGNYKLEAVKGKVSSEVRYEQYTLSMALRTDARGRSVYVADYQSGEPLPSVTLRLLKADKELAVSTLKLNGFTPLPDAMARIVDEGESRVSYTLEAVSADRRSKKLSLGRLYGSNAQFDGSRCNIYKDRGAYNPGDTVKFKAVVYKGDASVGLEVEKGKAVQVRLHDSEDHVLETLQLTTNEWGSVSGAFALPKEGLRGGRFELEVVGLGYDWFPVDEFVLPTFDLRFDPLTQLYLAGSEVPVSGQVISYSGHSLTGARVAVAVTRYRDVVLEKEQVLGADNRFSFLYPTAESGYYNVNVKVTDVTGETQEFNTGNYVGRGLSVETSFPDALDVDVSLTRQPRYYRYGTTVVGTRSLRVTLQACDDHNNHVPLPVSYTLLKGDGSRVLEGTLSSGQEGALELPANGLYTLKTRVSAMAPDGKEVVGTQENVILCVLPSDKTVAGGVERIFLPGATTIEASAPIEVRLGSAKGKIWVLASLFGTRREMLWSRQLTVQGGALEKISIPYLDSYPDVVRLQFFYFQDGEAVCYEREYRRAKDKYVLPLSFTRFQDKAYPGTEYTFIVKTKPGVEALVAAWDKSLDAMNPNSWPLVSYREVSTSMVPVSSVCGRVKSSGGYLYLEMRTGGQAKSVVAAVNDALDVVDEAVPLQLVETKPSFGYADVGVVARTDFSTVLTFQPHLYPKADGTLSLSFRTSDKLSTYYVRVYAHNKAMHNAVCEQEMVVSLPVKVSLQEPRFLYAGDVYEAAVTVSSTSQEPVSGTLVFRAGNYVQQVPVTVGPSETQTRIFQVEASVAPDELVMKASFISSEFTDAVQVKVPVYPAAQALTEAHSAVLHAGEDREALLAQLRSRFVNVPGSQAVLREISVLDMVRDAIPSHVEPKSNDVLSLSEAWYVQLMASRLQSSEDALVFSETKNRADVSEKPSASPSNLLAKVLSCQNADGGFGWFEGMTSSPIVTAVLLERVAKLRDRGFEVPDMTSAVKYLDQSQFLSVRPIWCGSLSDAQYMHVRALYAGVPFQVKPVTAEAKKRMKTFAKDAKAYLVPSKKAGRGMQGQILAKARRILTLRNLQQNEGGSALLKAWGVKLCSRSRLEKSVKADLASLLEYAVEHRDGGWYYPNAVMPWRGLLEEEAYAHALLWDLLGTSFTAGDAFSSTSLRDPVRANVPEKASPSAKAATIADGIRLWLMLQKETQHWDAEPEFVDAITAVLDGSEAVLGTKVLALSAAYTAPFSEIRASGNGFTLERKFMKGEQEIRPGDTLSVGDRITVQYHIWNGENRSFVRLVAGHEAALRPVQQLSGHIGSWFYRPFGSYRWGFVPQGYRNVKASATEFYFDSYPEENTVLQEEYFVTEAGCFQAPVAVIESLYAPHYRANSAPLPAVPVR